MKGCCISRIFKLLFLIILILAGICSYLGYQKAADAEAEKGSVATLYTNKVSPELAAMPLETGMIDTLIDQYAGEGFTGSIVKSTANGAVAALITKNYYLADDETISTFLGQKLLAHRLKKTYTKEELAKLYIALEGYDITGLSSLNSQELEALLQNGDLSALQNLPSQAAPILEGLVEDLCSQGWISRKNAAKLQEVLP